MERVDPGPVSAAPADSRSMRRARAIRVSMVAGGTGANGRSYKSIGALLIDEGKVPREKMSMQAIRAYLRQNPDDTSLRLELAEVFLRIGDGASAQGLLRRAVSMGVHERRVLVGLVRAAWLQEKWPELLALTAPRHNLPAADYQNSYA